MPIDPVVPLLPRVQKVLDDFFAQQRAVLHAASPELEPLLAAAAELTRGGKRLRPAFAYWGWRAAGRPDSDAAITAGAALELFHAAALVHDDLIDAADTRRGAPSVHRQFEARHRTAGFSGDPAAFGVAAAVLLGDLLLGWSDELLSSVPLASDDVARCRRVFERMRTEVGGGQYLDVLAQAHTDQSPALQADTARRVIRYKAARYTVEHPLVMGGELAAAPRRLLDSYATYGIALGEAFQLRDDILGVFGDPSVTGKPAGDDLREGKRTVLVAYALEQATLTQAAAIKQHLGDADLDAAGVEALRQVIVDTKALNRVERLISDQVTTARAALQLAEVTDEGGEALASLIDIATARAS